MSIAGTLRRASIIVYWIVPPSTPFLSAYGVQPWFPRLFGRVINRPATVRTWAGATIPKLNHTLWGLHVYAVLWVAGYPRPEYFVDSDQQSVCPIRLRIEAPAFPAIFPCYSSQ
ncbi:hypothetical protein BDV10DRAFT_31529 [Aspergillus recurvatus]